MSARVFISCGQSRDKDEETIANQIADHLINLGFDPYVAVAEQTLRGITDNIFARLRSSEYFIFVDFKRDKLAELTPATHRGSLFSHQELAIAAFLEIPVLVLQEIGVKADDGILPYIQANAVKFHDRKTLARLVAEKVGERPWKPKWQKELALERNDENFSVVSLWWGRRAKYFHIDVRNLHRDRAATNCYVYLDKIIRSAGSEITPKTVEFKWAGSSLPNVGIAPEANRPFDAFYIRYDEPTKVRFDPFTDSPEFVPDVRGAGEYTLCYRVMSDNFSPARASFTLRLDAAVEKTTLTLLR